MSIDLKTLKQDRDELRKMQAKIDAKIYERDSNAHGYGSLYNSSIKRHETDNYKAISEEIKTLHKNYKKIANKYKVFMSGINFDNPNDGGSSLSDFLKVVIRIIKNAQF